MKTNNIVIGSSLTGTQKDLFLKSGCKENILERFAFSVEDLEDNVLEHEQPIYVQPYRKSLKEHETM